MKVWVLRHWEWLVGIGIVLTRLPWILTRSVAFNFDHGKDALAVMHLLLTQSPKLIGPWTSIPGLYFGPAWYYFLAPWYLLGNFDPLAGVVAMLAWHLALLWFVKRYFGVIPAILAATAPTWLMVGSSAWNPFPMPAMSFLVLWALEDLRQKRVLQDASSAWKSVAILGLASSLGFHFSTAYAVFYIPIILATVWFYQIRVTWQRLGVFLVSFIVPFLPQLIFEIRHDFIETKAVLTYITAGSLGNQSATLWSVLAQTWAELRLAYLPDIGLPNTTLNYSISLVGLCVVLLAIVWSRWRHQTWGRWWFELGIWVIVPSLALVKLHFNVWYLLGMLPVVALFVGDVLARLPKWLLYSYLTLMIATPFSHIYRFYVLDLPILQQSRQLLPVKEQAIAWIRSQAGSEPFASYHYVPDIYDFTYQYLYLSQATQGLRLPTDFAYQPNTPTYIPEKTEIIAKLPDRVDARSPQKIFYIVEKASNQEFLQNWWNAQEFGEIVQVHPIGQELMVYEATPRVRRD